VITGPLSIRSRLVPITASAILLVESVVVAAFVARDAPELLPVLTSSGGSTFTVAEVNVGIGAIVPLVLGALLLLSGEILSGEILSGAVVDRRIRWLESSFSSSITVFLIAELNGIRELGTLVAIYALASAAVLFAALQEGRHDLPRMLPAAFGAMVGIVPWGLIAWYEIAPVVAGEPGPAPWVRVLTVVILALFASAAVLVWRGAGGSRGAIALSVVTRSVLALGIVVANASGLAVGSVG